MRQNANSNVKENANRVTCSGLDIAFLKCDMCHQQAKHTEKSHNFTSWEGRFSALLSSDQLLLFHCCSAQQEGTGGDRTGQDVGVLSVQITEAHI